MVNVFDFKDYKAYLKAVEAERSSIQRGFRSRLAELLDCQNAYISHTLNTHANFSLEQGLKIAGFLQLTDQETRYFLLLLEFARAGTKELQQYFQRDLQKLKDEFLNIKNRVDSKDTLTLEQEAIYYSNWIFAAVHILVTIPRFQSINKIYSSLAVPESAIREAVVFLLSTGLIVENKGQLSPGPTQLHLGSESANIRQHHMNWRLAAMQSLVTNRDQDLHYSTVSSLSLEDAEKLRAHLVQVVQDYVKVIRPSKEETLYNFNLDFYSLLKD